MSDNLAQQSSAQPTENVGKKSASKTRKKHKRIFKTRSLMYGAFFLTLFGFVGFGYESPTAQSTVRASATSAASGSSDILTASSDKVSASLVVANMAQAANLSIATNVTNASISLSSKADISQADDSVISKPSLVDSAAAARGVKSYTSVAGDSVPSLANKYGVSADTIRWANNLTSDALTPGSNLSIPGISGVVYTIKDGDTADSLASKYKSDAGRIVSYNDLEISGLTPGQKIILPGGILPDNEKPGYVAPRPIVTIPTATSAYAYTNASATGNNYDYGYCTWYAYNRRIQLGLPAAGNWGNANTWDNLARITPGYSVSSTPRVGSIAQTDYMSYWGHVAIVEAVSDDGNSIKFSDMNNLAGWGRVGYSGWVPASTFPNYIY